MLKVNITYLKKRKSILEVSLQLKDILVYLSKVDSLFSSPVLKGNQGQEFNLDLSSSRKLLVKTITESIISVSRDDILRYEKESEIDSSYSRDFGFSFMIKYQKREKTVTFTIKLGSSISNGLGILSSNGIQLDYVINRKMLIALVKSDDIEYGIIKTSDIQYLKKCRKYKYPLGVSTFLSNQLTFSLPLGLSHFEYLVTKNGVIVNLCLDNTSDYLSIAEKEFDYLLDAMEEIGKSDSTYLKSKLP